MSYEALTFWAKTLEDGQPGISVRDHCLNVGCVAEALIEQLAPALQGLLPAGAVTLAALHDVGKITLGFQAKCPHWVQQSSLPEVRSGEIALSVSDHALVSQVLLQELLKNARAALWAVAVGAHHGRPKGRNARLDKPEALAEWADKERLQIVEELTGVFGPLPITSPDPALAPQHSDLWLLAGLISVADWIGSNEAWFSPERGLLAEAARRQAREALREIGWPGGKLRRTGFSEAFSENKRSSFQPNSLQTAVSDVSHSSRLIVVEGPMGCGKTEAALFAAQQLIASGQQRGIYFALPTQVTSNRIYKRIERFLRNTLAEGASLRLAHGNAWLEDDFDLRLRPAYPVSADEADEVFGNLREARSWFASPKQALLAPYGVGTIDQALQSVVAVKHFFVRRFALAGKVVILDEIHSYDIYTGTLITALVRELISLRCFVIVLSATLTGARRKELLAAAGIAEQTAPATYPLVTSGAGKDECQHVGPEWGSHRQIALRTSAISEEETIEALIMRAEAGQHVLWIRNTVVEAQQAFRAACSSVRTGTLRVGLLHSRYPFQRRAELEEEWLEHLGRNRPIDGPGSLLIATQVVEQSVDIDLDFIVSDLAPTDMLLQRVGRLWRHERSHRQAEAPEFWIRLPELSDAFGAAELKAALGRSARVYAPYVLIRTAATWRGKTELLLPEDIRPLLEATYARPEATELEAWVELHEALEQDKATLSANAHAATLVLGRPMLQDADDVLTRRRGAPTTPVLLARTILRKAEGLVSLVALDYTQTDISEYEWRKPSASFVHRWLVRVPRWLVPTGCQRPRWLSLHAPFNATVAVVQEDGRCVFGDEVSSMSYDPRIGIFGERTTLPTPRSDDDDEFDY